VFHTIKKLAARISQFYFGIKPYKFRTVPLSIIRNISLYTAVVYVIQVCGELASRIRMKFHPDPACKLSANQYTIAVYSEILLMMDRRTVRNMQSFIPKYNSEISTSS
jgi:hypothetical protein